MVSIAAVKKPGGGTLERIRRAARELFVARGYHETRPQDIARAAGVANGTFYLHFADKQQAFLDFAEQAQSELLALLSARLANVSGGRARWKGICETLVEFSASNPGLSQAAFLDPVFIAPNDENAWRMYDRLGHLVSLVFKDEDLPESYNLELLSHGICGLLGQALIYGARKDVDRDKMIEELSWFIDRGIGSSPAKEDA